jgi:putative spermidine/putrescine transport system ATP-binding protein
VRPEHLELGDGGVNRITGSVAEMVYAGSETRILVDVAGSETITVRVPTGAPVPRLGEAVAVSWRPEAAVVVP